MITIVNYGLGNLGSILNMFKKIGVEAKLSESVNDILNADKLLLPGVGSFDTGMKNLMESGYIESLNKKVLQENTPVLGICLGLQLMTKGSEEGTLNGLGWFDADTVKFDVDSSKHKIPHMGWDVVIQKKESKLLNEMYEEPRFYFVHSYHLETNAKDDVLLTANYGYEFVCGFQKNNMYGVQFHPEKSHKFGMRLLKNFADNC